MTKSKAIIVGSGPAGIGVACLLNEVGIDYLVLEKNEIGASFSEWPENMEMITPSFPSNAFGQMDLNSICGATSPAFSFQKEHLTGDDYAKYLSMVAAFNELNIEMNTEVKNVFRINDDWILETNQGEFVCTYLIWAAGEFQNPQINITGEEYCVHSSLIKEASKLKGEDFVVVGGYESGVQMATELIKNNKKVTLINPTKINQIDTSDPSQVLSPYTISKYNELKKSPNYTEVIGEVESFTKEKNNYSIHLKGNKIIESNEPPICATGFSLVQKPIEKYITFREDGFPLLNEETDELYEKNNLYLTGPSVRHDNHIFCFIYKFRQRFGIIVSDMMNKEMYGINDIVKFVTVWKRNGLYLSDLSCCDEECKC